MCDRYCFDPDPDPDPDSDPDPDPDDSVERPKERRMCSAYFTDVERANESADRHRNRDAKKYAKRSPECRCPEQRNPGIRARGRQCPKRGSPGGRRPGTRSPECRCPGRRSPEDPHPRRTSPVRLCKIKKFEIDVGLSPAFNDCDSDNERHRRPTHGTQTPYNRSSYDNVQPNFPSKINVRLGRPVCHPPGRPASHIFPYVTHERRRNNDRENTLCATQYRDVAEGNGYEEDSGDSDDCDDTYTYTIKPTRLQGSRSPTRMVHNQSSQFEDHNLSDDEELQIATRPRGRDEDEEEIRVYSNPDGRKYRHLDTNSFHTYTKLAPFDNWILMVLAFAIVLIIPVWVVTFTGK
ncbi:hypothetical protein LSAT2_011521 [Lamellibrachia satsuma]|nr:hypothetical protein LSAT2_011521 [Lamellibrachia satsuma]